MESEKELNKAILEGYFNRLKEEYAYDLSK